MIDHRLFPPVGEALLELNIITKGFSPSKEMCPHFYRIHLGMEKEEKHNTNRLELLAWLHSECIFNTGDNFDS